MKMPFSVWVDQEMKRVLGEVQAAMPPPPSPEKQALINIQDEILSILHARQLKADEVDSDLVRDWLQDLYDLAEVGQGGKSHFHPDP